MGTGGGYDNKEEKRRKHKEESIGGYGGHRGQVPILWAPVSLAPGGRRSNRNQEHEDNERSKKKKDATIKYGTYKNPVFFFQIFRIPMCVFIVRRNHLRSLLHGCPQLNYYNY